MTVIIFEGIASSGKTTIEKKLADRLGNTIIISEDETLMPVIDNHDPNVAVGHLNQIVERIRIQSSRYVIVDRFHVTHAFRTKTNLDDFAAIEESLANFGDVLLVLLTIETEKIPERIQETIEYRKDGWNKGGQGAQTLDEKVEYYRDQQMTLKQLVLKSRLTSIVVDTTDKDWECCVDLIEKNLS